MPRFALLHIQQWNLKLHISCSLKGFPITQNSLAWRALAPWLIKSLWNHLRYSTSLLLRARGRSGGRLCLCYKPLDFPAEEQKQQRMSKGQSWMSPDSAATNSRAGLSPETEPKCYSILLFSWHPREGETGDHMDMRSSGVRLLQAELWHPRFCYSSTTLPWALLPLGTAGRGWKRDLLWQRYGTCPLWLMAARDSPLPLQLWRKLFLPANLRNLGLSHLHL